MAKKDRERQQDLPGQFHHRTLSTPSGHAPGYKVRKVESLPPEGQMMDFVYDESQSKMCVWNGREWVCWESGICYDYILDSEGHGTHTSLQAIFDDIPNFTANTPPNVWVCAGHNDPDTEVTLESSRGVTIEAAGPSNNRLELNSTQVYLPDIKCGAGTPGSFGYIGAKNIVFGEFIIYDSTGGWNFNFENVSCGGFSSDPAGNLNEGYIVDSAFKDSFLGFMDLPEIQFSTFERCDFTTFSVGTMWDVTLTDCRAGAQGTTAPSGLVNGQFVIRNTYENVTFQNCSGNINSGFSWHGRPTALVVVRSMATRMNGDPPQDATGLIIANCISDPTTSARGCYLVIADTGGTGTVPEVLVQGNSLPINNALVKAAKGAFQDSVFGPNYPDNLDYSEVTGTGNVFYTTGTIGTGGTSPFISGRIQDSDNNTSVDVSTGDRRDSTIAGTLRERLSALGLELANGSHFSVFSDALVTLKAFIDSATGDLRVAGYIRAGGVTAPVSTGDGDIVGTRFFVNNDNLFSLQILGGNPFFLVASGDGFVFDRAANRFEYQIGSAVVASFNSALVGHQSGLIVGSSDLTIDSLAASVLARFESTVKGVQLPRMTAAERNAIGSPAEALIIYNTDSDQYEYWNAATAAWTGFAGAGGSHDLLSATHGDTVASAVSRGSTIVGNSTPKYAEFPIGAAETLYSSDGTDVVWRAHYITQNMEWQPDAAALTAATLNPVSRCVGESGEHGTQTLLRAKATAGVAGTGTNTILIEADDNPAFSSPTVLFTLALNTSTEVDDTVLDNAWASGDIHLRARCSAVGGTAPQNVVVTVYMKQQVENY